jgi:hypothetical protein
MTKPPRPRTRKIRLALDEDAITLLTDLAGGERRRGKYLSQLIREVARQKRQAEIVRLQAELAALQEPDPPAGEGAV